MRARTDEVRISLDLYLAKKDASHLQVSKPKKKKKKQGEGEGRGVPGGGSSDEICTTVIGGAGCTACFGVIRDLLGGERLRVGCGGVGGGGGVLREYLYLLDMSEYLTCLYSLN